MSLLLIYYSEQFTIPIWFFLVSWQNSNTLRLTCKDKRPLIPVVLRVLHLSFPDNKDQKSTRQFMANLSENVYCQLRSLPRRIFCQQNEIRKMLFSLQPKKYYNSDSHTHKGCTKPDKRKNPVEIRIVNRGCCHPCIVGEGQKAE